MDTNELRSSKLAKWVFASLVGVLTTISAPNLGGAQAMSEPQHLQFVSQSPLYLTRPDYTTVTVFSISDQKHLDTVWTLVGKAMLSNVRVFPGMGSIIITEDDPFGATDVYSINSRALISNINLDAEMLVFRTLLYDDGNDLGQLMVVGEDRMTAKAKSVFVLPNRKVITSSVSGANLIGELRLAGAAKLYGSGDHDIATIEFITSTSPTATGSEQGIVWSAFPVPLKVIVRKDIQKWNMFAHEPTFLGLAQSPDGVHRDRELLFLNRTDNEWHSVIVPGDVSTCQPLNGWINCQVLYSDRRTEWQSHRGYPAIPTDSIVLINPSTRQQLIFDLGADSEILWIESDTVYYRSGESLYRARLGDTDIVDRQLILTDPRVKYIHWAYRLPTSDTGN